MVYEFIETLVDLHVVHFSKLTLLVNNSREKIQTYTHDPTLQVTHVRDIHGCDYESNFSQQILLADLLHVRELRRYLCHDFQCYLNILQTAVFDPIAHQIFADRQYVFVEWVHLELKYLSDGLSPGVDLGCLILDCLALEELHIHLPIPLHHHLEQCFSQEVRLCLGFAQQFVFAGEVCGKE